MLYYGYRVPIDKEAGVGWLGKTAEKGHVEAQCWLARQSRQSKAPYCIHHIISRGIGMASVTWFRRVVEYRVDVLCKKTNTHLT